MTASRRVVWALVGVALVLRLLHVHALADELLGESPNVGMDRWMTMRMGVAVAQGDWLGGWTADYDSGPAYGYWLGWWNWLAGGRWVLAVIAQSVLGAMVVPVVYAIGCRLGSRTVGGIAAVLAALYAPTIFYETLMVKFSLVPIAVAWLVWWLVHERWTPRQMLATGAALGTLSALRGNAALLWPVVVWIVAGEPSTITRLARASLLVSVGALAVLAPFMARDRIAAQQGRGVSLWGIHFFLASHPGADGTYAPVEGVSEDTIGHVVDARRIAEQDRGRGLTPTEVSLYWLERGVAFARAEPWYFLRLQARKLRLALAGYEEGSFGDEYNDVRERSWVLQLPLVTFGALCPLAVLGVMTTLARSRTRRLSVFVAAYLLSLLPLFVTGRYRLPIVIPMQLLAAAGLVWIDTMRRAGAYRDLILALAGMALLAVGLPGDATDPWRFVAVFVVGVSALALQSSPEPVT